MKLFIALSVVPVIAPRDLISLIAQSFLGSLLQDSKSGLPGPPALEKQLTLV